MNVTDEIKSRIDIVDLVSESVKLRRTGKNFIGFCPFHANTHSPAFVVFPDTGTWRCFGECNEGGDIFKFVMKKEGWDFTETLKALSKRAGVKLEPLTAQKKEQIDQADRYRQLLEDALIYYHSLLVQTPRGKEANQYLLEKRGLKPLTIETFGIGYSSDSWEAGINHFTQKGYSTTDLLEAGMIVQKEDGGFYDRFRDRIMFPVRDVSGRMAGFGARILNPQDNPKFINSPQTVLFDKSGLLFGLDQARKAIRAADQAVIVEGYLDVVLLHQEGFQNTVSPMGTALTEAQMRQIKHFSRRIVMALDPDSAGIKATLRGLEVARQALDHSDDLIFDARGLIHHESRLQADLRVSALPEGMDPDDIVRKDPEQWKIIIKKAKPIITHVLDTLTQGQDLGDPKTKSQIANQIMPLIRDVPNPVERDAYRQQLARTLQIDERSLVSLATPVNPSRSYLKNPSQIETPENKIPSLSSDQEKTQRLEKHCLRLMVRHPEVIYQINRFFQSQGLINFTENDFESAEHQQIAGVLLQSLEQDKVEPAEFIQNNLPPLLIEVLQELLNLINEGEPDNTKLIGDLQHTMLMLRYSQVNKAVNNLRFLQEAAQQDPESEPNAFQKEIMDLITIRRKLDNALVRPQ